MNRLFGLHRASVVNAIDPLAAGRLLVSVPSAGITGAWALPCVPYTASERETVVPPPGSLVWVMFEQGDVDSPVWLGVFPAGPEISP